MPLARVADLKLTALPRHTRADGAVVVLEAPLVPFATARVFTVTAKAGAVRGRHAHRVCSQLIYCASGAVVATADDGTSCVAMTLEDGNGALLVPPGIWLELAWRTDDAALTVLCDRPYEEADYLRDRAQFVAWRNSNGMETGP